MVKPRWTLPDGCTHAVSRNHLSREQLQFAERLAYEHGESYDSYLLMETGREYFFGRNSSGAPGGVVAFRTWRDHVYVVGGLLAPAGRKSQLLADFLDFVQLNQREVSFLNVLAVDVPVFREFGFQVSKVGEEPVIDLQQTTWQGSDFAWVRRQENYCLRNGLKFREVEPDPRDPEYASYIVPQLLQVSEEHLHDSVYNRELGMMTGRVDLENMFRKRLFVAQRGAGIEAFVVATPARNGTQWAVEMFRRRPSATRGVIPFLILQVARQMQQEGIRLLSLCQVPALRVDRGTPSDSRLVVNGLRFWWNWLPWFYDTPRLYHFKSRFRPQYRECFIATWPRAKFWPLFAFFFLWGIIVPDFTRLPVQMLRRMRKWWHTEHLADPETEPYRILETFPAKQPAVTAPAASAERDDVEWSPGHDVAESDRELLAGSWTSR